MKKKSMHRSIPFLVALLAFLFFDGSAFCATYYVPDDFAAIQTALSSPSVGAGDTIIVRDGTYTGASNKNLDFGGKAVTLQSENGAAYCTIDCENNGRAFYFHSGETSASVVDGFTITNGSSALGGGGIYCLGGSSPTIMNCDINNNMGLLGGGILCYNSSSPIISNCEITDNTAGYGGGLNCTSESSPTISDCTFTGNSATNYGGAIRCAYDSVPDIDACSITGNTADVQGGGIHFYFYSSPTITNCNIAGNSAGDSGGGIYCEYYSSPTVVHCTVTGNTAVNYGGGIYSYFSSDPTITNSIFWDDSAASGNEIAIGTTTYPASLTVNYCDIEGGQAAAYVESGCTLTWAAGNINSDPQFVLPGYWDTGNWHDGDYHLDTASDCIDAGVDAGVVVDIDGGPRPEGGGYDMGSDETSATFYVPDDYSTIKGAIQGVADNSVIIVRDGVYTGANNRNLSFNGKTLTLRSENGPDNCIIDCENVQGGFIFWAGETNAAVVDGFTVINGNAGYGGGIYCTNSSPTIRNCIFKDGSSAYGAGICLSNSSARIINCTVTGGSGTYGAGGIFFYGSDATITNCTISGNSATSGAGVFCFSSTPTFTNSIITGNSGTYGPQVLLSTYSDMAVSYSNIEGGQAAAYLEVASAFTWGVGNIDADPLFVGGGDYHLTYNSPCVNAGLDTGLTSDIEGDARPLAGGIDMGSDEFSTIYYIPDDYSTFKEAMLGVSDNCIVVVRDGTYTGSNNRNIAFQNKSVILKSENGPENCIIDCQNASGGFVFWQGETSASVLDGFTITNGNAGYGGGIYSVGSSPTIRNCVIKNSSAAYGGGICLSVSSATIINCTLVGNSATYGAAGLFCYASDPVITHCTISNNTTTSGGGIFCHSSSPTMTNCIVTGNTATYGPQILLSVSSILDVSYCNVQGGQAQAYVEPSCSFVWGSGNIDLDPLFVGGGDYHLALGSPCIDAGTDAGVNCDIDSDVRPRGSGYDIGSDEY